MKRIATFLLSTAFISTSYAAPITVGTGDLKGATLQTTIAFNSSDGTDSATLTQRILSAVTVAPEPYGAYMEMAVKDASIAYGGWDDPTTQAYVNMEENFAKMDGLVYDQEYDLKNQKITYQNFSKLAWTQRAAIDKIMAYLQNGYIGGMTVNVGQEVFKYDIARVMGDYDNTTGCDCLIPAVVRKIDSKGISVSFDGTSVFKGDGVAVKGEYLIDHQTGVPKSGVILLHWARKEGVRTDVQMTFTPKS